MCCLCGNAPAAAVGHLAGGPRAARVGAGVARPGSASRDRDTGSSRAVHARSATPAGAGSGSAAQTGQPQAAGRPRRGRVAPARHALDSGEPLSPIQCELRGDGLRSEEHTSELQSLAYLVCRLLLEKKKKNKITTQAHSPTISVSIAHLSTTNVQM